MSDRREISLRRSRVDAVLPEFFRGEYPNLVAFLEHYYDYADSDGEFNDDLRRLFENHDIDGMALTKLDYLFGEIGDGLRKSIFDDPRETLKNISDFFRNKGTAFGAAQYFRLLYDEDVVVEYPKDNTFMVGASLIGPEGDLIQDGALYQVLSVLVKSERAFADWGKNYKKFVHPSGFYLGAEVEIEALVGLTSNISVLYDSDGTLGAERVYEATIAPLTLAGQTDQITSMYDDPTTGLQFRIDTVKNIDHYGNATAGGLATQYPSLRSMTDPNSPQFSDSDSAGGVGIDFSNTVETFDYNQFDPPSDSA
jgi:hypothetical protein